MRPASPRPLGIFHALTGLTAILKDKLFVPTPNYLISVDVTSWGWIHLIGRGGRGGGRFFVFSGGPEGSASAWPC